MSTVSLTPSYSFEDLREAVALSLGDIELGTVDCATLGNRLRERMGALEGPAALEDDFGMANLELGVLRGLHEELLGYCGTAAAVH